MINFVCVGLFEELIEAYQNYSILPRALQKGIAKIDFVNIRSYSKDKHRNTDDYPYGGGAGMVLTPQPVYDAVQAAKQLSCGPVVCLSPIGQTLDNALAKKYSELESMILLCGHYEGIDQRALDLTVDEYVSIGDFVLTGGEIAAIVLMDSILRYKNGFLGNTQSSSEESFENGLLEYVHYTRPEIFQGLAVPEVLLSGHHEKIKEFRQNSSLEQTKKHRPDLYDIYQNKHR